MFPTPMMSPRNVIVPSQSYHGRHRFRLSPMEVLSRKSSDTFVNRSINSAVSSPLSSRPKHRQSCVKAVRDPSVYLTAGLQKHFADARFSDLIVRCRDDEYHVHRVILCSHSQWFAKVCATASPVRQPYTDLSIQSTHPSQTTESQCIDLSADDPDAVDAMLQYCYQLDYADKFLGLSSAGYTIYTLSPHIDIYLLADRYAIPGLKQLAIDKFESRAIVLSKVEVNKDKFFQAIRVIYASTRAGDDGLRRVAVRLCADHSEKYILQGGKTAARVFKLMDDIPAFRMDFIKELAVRLK
ncbi:hypothetical protein P154DRAFT_523594 [Amniculicola lignicola CBS 123094]|uniref:BTB domain-containing protein n=1 Tax=Amniculicola lignicola CBS 123094 TaxID=1392246 RepID=A0A6A5WCV1_9PLEO|nr:hypothetical protein P154DRAFT_523594 [Amniculicola lignicola CBS 123094]